MILLLNPDTELEGNYMREILDFADAQENLGCLGVRFHDLHGNFCTENASVLFLMCLIPLKNYFHHFNRINLPRKTITETTLQKQKLPRVEVITGAFLLMKRELYLEIGGLDESYFMYGEDIDLCYTLLKKRLSELVLRQTFYFAHQRRKHSKR